MGSEAGRPGSALSDRVGSVVPKFKSAAPPSLLFSPSSFFDLNPSHLLDSPLLFSSSHIFPSPTTGTFPAQSLNWNNNNTNRQETKHDSDFSFTTNHTAFSSSSLFQSSSAALSTSKARPQNSHPSLQPVAPNSELQSYKDNKTSDDGYNWRKYGQKQVKGSVNPRSYYKCTFPNCPTKKKVERSLVDGRITEIVYKGSHNHPKPQSTRRSQLSSSPLVSCNESQTSSSSMKLASPEQSFASRGSGQIDSTATPDNSTVSFGNEDFHQRNNSGDSQEFDEDEPGAKRWKREGEKEGAVGGGSRNSVKEPRVVVQTTSDIDILVDGYRWRKYGQKVVKGNPNPRSYYKCTYSGCLVRKHVERAFHDPRAVITTYEGKHNHDVPTARSSNNNAAAGRRAEGTVCSQSTAMLQNLGGFGNLAGKTEQVENVMFGRDKEEARDENVQFLESLLA